VKRRFHYARRLTLAKIFDFRSPEERRCAIVIYRVDFALWQEWRIEARRAENIRKLRGCVDKLKGVAA
jgi:hypothetical protein